MPYQTTEDVRKLREWAKQLGGGAYHDLLQRVADKLEGKTQ